MKFNPLFQDSTVSKGTNVQTKFELSGLNCEKDEKVYLKTTVDGKVKLLEMFSEENGVFQASIWVEHRTNLKYQFCVMKDKEVVKASIEKTALALHTIMEKWCSSLEEKDLTKVFNEKPGRALGEAEIVESKESNGEEFFDNLIDKWDL